MSGHGQPPKHGAARFWKKGILPSSRRHLAAHADAAIREITLDLGGVDALTGTQRVMLAQLRRCLIFLALIDRWLADHAFIDDKGNLAGPMNAFYLSALNSSTRICERIGLERKAPADNLESYLALTYGKDKPAAGAGPAIEAGKPSSKGAGRKRSSPTIDSGEVKND